MSASVALALPAPLAPSALTRHPVVVSATSDSPNPGLALFPLIPFCPFSRPSPGWWSVKMYTSGRNLFRTALDASTRRFPVCGETRTVKATPRTRFTRPSSVQSIVLSSRAIGSLSWISPVWPPASALRRTICNARPSSTPNRRLRIGSVTARNVSTEISASSLVTPTRVTSTGFFANRPTQRTISRKYPIPRLEPQSCRILRPPVTIPGLYLSAVPDSLISTAIPFVSLSSRRSAEAS